MTRCYRIHEFAGLAGVTVKALYHYDRLGLLKPRRTGAGYRMYTEHDLERLEQIIALKFLGLPLKRMKDVLDSASLALPDVLRIQRKALEEKQRHLGRAIHAIQTAESAIEPGQPSNPAILKRIIEVLNMQKVDMQETIDEMKRYYKTEEAWVKRREYYEQWPSDDWKALYRDIEAALGEDPSSDRSAALARRWMMLVENETSSDPDVRMGMAAAWNDRQYWPAGMLQRVSEFDIEKIWAFAGKAIIALRKQYYSDDALVRAAGVTPDDPEWYSLLLETVAVLGETPSTEKAHALAARWAEVNPSDQTSERARALIARWRELAKSSAHGGDTIERQLAMFTLEKTMRFLSLAAYRRYRTFDGFFRDVEAALSEDLSSEKAQTLAARWSELLEADAGGDRKREAEYRSASAKRHAWPAILRCHVAFEEVTKFLDSATTVPARL